jgi:hypothetical protein
MMTEDYSGLTLAADEIQQLCEKPNGNPIKMQTIDLSDPKEANLLCSQGFLLKSRGVLV